MAQGESSGREPSKPEWHTQVTESDQGARARPSKEHRMRKRRDRKEKCDKIKAGPQNILLK